MLTYENCNYYLSRGGKRKFCLEKTVLHKYLVKRPNIFVETNNEILQEMKRILTGLLKNSKIGNKTREKLTKLDDLVDEIL